MMALFIEGNCEQGELGFPQNTKTWEYDSIVKAYGRDTSYREAATSTW